jgi:hypothetical protein
MLKALLENGRRQRSVATVSNAGAAKLEARTCFPAASATFTADMNFP